MSCVKKCPLNFDRGWDRPLPTKTSNLLLLLWLQVDLMTIRLQTHIWGSPGAAKPFTCCVSYWSWQDWNSSCLLPSCSLQPLPQIRGLSKECLFPKQHGLQSSSDSGQSGCVTCWNKNQQQMQDVVSAWMGLPPVSSCWQDAIPIGLGILASRHSHSFCFG